MEVSELIDKLVPCTLPINGKDYQSDVPAEDVWKTIIKLAESDQKKFFIAFTFISEYVKRNAKFTEENPAQIAEDIAKISSLENIEEKTKLFKKLFSIMPFFTVKNFDDFVSVAINYVQKQLNENQTLPTEFLDIMQLADLSIISDVILIRFYESIKLYFTTENRAAAMIISTLLIQDIIDNEGEDAGEFFVQIVTEGLSADTTKQEKLAALYLLSKLNHYLGSQVADEVELPMLLFKELSALFVSDDDALFTVSHKTMVQLIKCGVFSEKEHISAVIGQYEAYKEERIPQFYKFIVKYLDDYESVPTTIVQIIYDFLISINGKGTPLRNAFCIEAFSLLAAVNKDVFDDTSDALLQVAQNLLETSATNPLIASKVACLVLALSKTIPDILPTILEKFIPTLVECLKSETKKEDRKAKLDLAQSVSATIEGSKLPQFSAPTIDFAIKMLEEARGGELVYIGSTVLGLRLEFSKEQACSAFKQLSAIVERATVSEDVNICLHMMKKLMAKHEIDQELIIAIIDKIVSGHIESLCGIEPYLSSDAKTMIFYFIAAFMKKYPLKSGSYASRISSWVPRTRVELLPAVLEAVEASIVAAILKPEDIANLYTIIMNLFVKVPVTAEEEYCSVVEILILLINNYPNACESKSILMASTQMLALCHGVDCGGDEEDGVDVEPCEDTLVLPTIVRLVLATFASTKLNAEVSKDLINGVLEDIPTSALSDILPVLLNLLKQAPRFKVVLVPICRIVTELLMLKKSDFEELGISDEKIANAKSVLKEVFKANKLVEKQIARDYSSSRAKLNKFNALLK